MNLPKLNGHAWGIIQGIMIAAITGLITMYGTTASLSAKFDMLCTQVSKLEGRIDKVGDSLVEHIIGFHAMKEKKDAREKASIGK